MRVWYNSSLQSKNFVVPGLIAIILMILTGQLTTLTIAREWEMGTMEQILSTPLRPAEMVLGKMLAYFVVGLVDAILAFVAGITVFAVPFRGSLLVLAVSTLVFLCGAMFWGIFISAGARTQVVAYQMGMLDHVLAGLSAFRVRVLDRHHAEVDSGNQRRGAFALFHHHPEVGVSQGSRTRDPLAAACVPGAVQRLRILARGAENASEGGVNHVGTNRRHPPEGVHPAVPRPAHARAAVHSSAAAADIFGYAVTLDVDNAKIAWMDGDNTPESRALLARFEGSGRFQVVATLRSERMCRTSWTMATPTPSCACYPNFARELARRKTRRSAGASGRHQLQYRVAGFGLRGGSDRGLLGRRIARTRRRTTRPSSWRCAAPARARRSWRARRCRARASWFNPDLRSRNYFVPGVAVNILFMVTLMLTAQAIIREKEIGTMEQLMVTPMRPIELMLGKTIPFALIGLVDLVVVTAGALMIFRVPFRGSFLVLFFSATIFLLTSLGAGLFLSTISHTQQQANMMSFFFSSPAFMLSGFNFPIRNMPVSVQYLTYLNPLRYFMEIVRGRVFEGRGRGRTVAADPGLADLRRADFVVQRDAVPQEFGLDFETGRRRSGKRRRGALKRAPRLAVIPAWDACGSGRRLQRQDLEAGVRNSPRPGGVCLVSDDLAAGPTMPTVATVLSKTASIALED